MPMRFSSKAKTTFYYRDQAALKYAKASPLSAAEAQALAQKLANESARALYDCEPFRNGPSPQLVQGRWVWHDSKGYGTGDIEATVKFGPDGANPEVNVIQLSNSRR